MDACPKGNSKNRLAVTTIVLGALCIDPDGVGVVHVSVVQRAVSRGKITVIEQRTIALPDLDVRHSWQQSGTLAQR